MNKLLLQQTVTNALIEDIGVGDWTTEGIFGPEDRSAGVFLFKSAGVVAGVFVVKEVFRQLDGEVTVRACIPEGRAVEKGTVVAEIKGPTRSILTGERVALNFFQRLSGIATATARYVAVASKYGAKIIDTRKTTPGLRFLEKYAVKAGGGYNHRSGLYDAVLIKDNHLAAAGGIAAAVQKVKEMVPFMTPIEVEVEDLQQLEEALAAGADFILLDNMPVEMTKQAVKQVNHRVPLEASGGITLETVEQVAATGVEYISVGALTHSVKAMDISLDLS